MRGVKVNGEALLSARQRAGFTQVALALAADVDAKTIRKAERGERIDMLPLTRLAKALDIAPGALIEAGDADTTLQKRYREVVETWNRVWDVQDMEGAMALYHDDAVLRLPGKPVIPFGGEHRGKAAIRRAYEIVWSTVPQEPHPLDEITILVSERGVAVKGETAIHGPQGEMLRLPSLQTFLFVDELIIDHEVHFDSLDFANRVLASS